MRHDTRPSWMRIGRGLAAVGGLALLALLAYLVLAPGPLAIDEVTHGSTLIVSAPRRWVAWTPDCVPVRWNLEAVQAVALRTLNPEDDEARSGQGDEVVCGFDRPRLEITLADGSLRTIEVAPALAAQPLFWAILAGALALLWPGRAWALIRAAGRWLERFRPRRRLQPGARAEARFLLRVGGKAALLFLALNLIFALLNPVDFLGRLSLYNLVFPGRERLPSANDPALAYNVTMENLEALFASHAVAAPKAPDEYRVLLLGDSATWGRHLRPEHTLSGWLNAAGLHTADGRRVRVYNIAHPQASLPKDLLLLSYGLRYAPDLVVWPITLYALYSDSRQITPLERVYPQMFAALIEAYDLDPASFQGRLEADTLLDWTVIARRHSLNQMLRLHFYGLMWATTGIDQPYADPGRMIDRPDNGAPPLIDAPLGPGGFDLVAAGIAMANPVPVLLINEPVFIPPEALPGDKLNTHYSVSAYAAYRADFRTLAETHGWTYIDLGDAVDPAEFTDTSLHYSPEGARQFSQALAPALLELANSHLDDTP